MLARLALVTTVCGCASSADDAGASSEGAAASTVASSDEGTTGALPIVCADVALRLATFNIRGVGAVGSVEHDALALILARIDADVVCLQEVDLGDEAAIEALAASLGLDLVRANYSPPIGGEISNACLSRIPIDRIESYTASELSTDFDANDLGRDILAVRVFPTEGCEADVLVVHLKSGEETSDLFRRQVEVVRLVQALALVRGVAPSRPAFVVGDFNESLDDPALGTTLATIPAGLPDSYRLGDDIVLPLVYDPFGPLADAALAMVDATLEDSTDTSTWSSTVRLDYEFQAGATPTAAEVYDSCRDDGIDDPDLPGGLAKAGDPLACGVSEDASDHRPVVVDFALAWP